MSLLKDIIPFGDVIGKVIDRVFPDPADAAKAHLEILKMNQAGEFRVRDSLDASDRNQAEINKIDAASERFFQYGWRSAAGWVAVSALAVNYLIIPLMGYVASNWLKWPIPQQLDTQELIGLLFALLGLGGYRSFEILKGRRIAG